MQRIIAIIDIEMDKSSWNLRCKIMKAYLIYIWRKGVKPQGFTIKPTNIHGFRLVFGTKESLESILKRMEITCPDFERDFETNFTWEVQSESAYASICFVQWPTKLVELVKSEEKL